MGSRRGKADRTRGLQLLADHLAKHPPQDGQIPPAVLRDLADLHAIDLDVRRNIVLALGNSDDQPARSLSTLAPALQHIEHVLDTKERAPLSARTPQSAREGTQRGSAVPPLRAAQSAREGPQVRHRKARQADVAIDRLVEAALKRDRVVNSLLSVSADELLEFPGVASEAIAPALSPVPQRRLAQQDVPSAPSRLAEPLQMGEMAMATPLEKSQVPLAVFPEKCAPSAASLLAHAHTFAAVTPAGKHRSTPDARSAPYLEEIAPKYAESRTSTTLPDSRPSTRGCRTTPSELSSRPTTRGEARASRGGSSSTLAARAGKSDRSGGEFIGSIAWTYGKKSQGVEASRGGVARKAATHDLAEEEVLPEGVPTKGKQWRRYLPPAGKVSAEQTLRRGTTG